METLSEEAFREILSKLLGIPTLEEREVALPIARKWVLAYQVGELTMTQKQIECLIKGIEPTPSERSK